VTDKKQILKLMDESEAVFLATAGEKGPSIRALVNLRRADAYPGIAERARRDGFAVYLATSRKSSKVREIVADPRVSLYYCVPARYEGVTLNGTARIADDKDLRRALWCEAWRIYWPDGLADPDYCVLRVEPTDIFGWCGTEAFHYDPATP
jgi:general stress protein 26